jgi:predicted amidohydrolase
MEHAESWEVEDMRLAVVQMNIISGNLELNRGRFAVLAEEAANMGAEIALFPECTFTGYDLQEEEALRFSESIPGPITDYATDVCKTHGLFVAFGTIERGNDGCLYNSALLLGPDGFLKCYRKTHIPYFGVDKFMCNGDKIVPPMCTVFGSLGLLICHDILFPETARTLALLKAQIILIPTAWPAGASIYSDCVLRTRAYENGIYLAAANGVGKAREFSYLGRSIVVGPDGNVIAEANTATEEVLCVTIDIANSSNKHRTFRAGENEMNIFMDRHPELYREITRKE